MLKPAPLFRPARKGRLFLLLLMKPLMLEFGNGVPPLTGKKLLLGFEKGAFVTALAMIPVTALADGCVPPTMSCMKKDRTGCSVPAPAPARAGTAGDVAVGPAMGATVAGEATGGATSDSGASVASSGVSVSGTGASALSPLSMVSSSLSSAGVAGAVAEICPLGQVAVGVNSGSSSSGTVVERGLGTAGELEKT